MTSEQIKLVAAYLNGEKVAVELLAACKADKALLKYVAELSAVERLISHHANNDGSELFVDEINKRMNQLPDENFVQNTMKQLKYEHSYFHKYRKIFILTFLVILSLLTVSIYTFNLSDPLTHDEVARVNKVAGALNMDVKIDTNQIIRQGKFELTQGYVELELKNGVRLLMEGPVKLDVKSNKYIILNQGSLVAKVPATTHDFILGTPNTEINQGEEFGVHVSQKGESQIHALQGAVKTRFIHQKNFEYIQEHQARAFDVNHQIQIIKNNPEQFMRALPGKSSKVPEYLHWSFDSQISGKYQCNGRGIEGKCYDAVAKNLNQVKLNELEAEGKFGSGVYLNGVDSWLETEFPGIGGNDPRTVSFWVKVPTDFTPSNGYGILSWGLSHIQSAWQISPNPDAEDGPLGRIRIGTNKAQIIGTTNITDQRWHHVAIVLFGGEQANLSTHVLMYLDGKLEQSSAKSIAKIFTRLSHPKSKPLVMGRNIAFSKINNNKARFFRGWLDEVFIFNAALEQEQIHQLMEFNQLNQ
ncbi:LamG domain-containing protein [Colwellia sp. UCD-KL20]|uniref:LamG domain-containing protein n=1 Tax=Colwellia sp. UCD-KL20 TaxID=1917165 RepID=UPI000970B974|nr:LamG domain-containing protein [Colwellia sp. UCD-KL20]